MRRLDRPYLVRRSIDGHDDPVIKMVVHYHYWQSLSLSNEMQAQKQEIHVRETLSYDNDNIVDHKMDHRCKTKHR